MMKIKPTNNFYRAYKAYKKKHYQMSLVDDCVAAIVKNDTDFLKSHKDHVLIGELRELHVHRQYNDDWLLIYRIDQTTDEVVLILLDLGDHDSLSRKIHT